MISTKQFILRTRFSYFAYARKVFCVCPQGVLRRLARLRDRLSVLARRALRPCRMALRTPQRMPYKKKVVCAEKEGKNLHIKEIFCIFAYN
jgi:hypothetical protein